MTMFDDSGKETYSMVNEVIELSSATLDAALFEIPQGYREVKDSTELYASMSGSTSSNSNSTRYSDGNSTSSNSGMSSTVQNLSKSSSNVKTEVGAKKKV
jgi:hypothetical protein